MVSIYQLKLKSGKEVTWEGENEEDAARRYVDCFRNETVVATRPSPTGVFFYNPKTSIVE